MRSRFFLLFMFAAFAAVPLYSQDTESSEAKANHSKLEVSLRGQGADQKDIQQIENLLDEFHEAYVKADASFYRQNLSDNFVRLNPDGRLLDKQQMTELVEKRKQDAARTEGFSHERTSGPEPQHRAAFFGDTAIFATHYPGAGPSGQQEGTSQFVVLAKRNGRWQIAGFDPAKMQPPADTEDGIH